MSVVAPRASCRFDFRLADFFENATVAEQAALIRSRLSPGQALFRRSPRFRGNRNCCAVVRRAADQTIPPRDRSLPCPLSPNQRTNLVHGASDRRESRSTTKPRRYGFAENWTLSCLRRPLNAIVARRENLRTSIRAIGDEPSAFVHDSWRLRIKTIDLSELPRAQRESGSRAAADRGAADSLSSRDRARNPRHFAPPEGGRSTS